MIEHAVRAAQTRINNCACSTNACSADVALVTLDAENKRMGRALDEMHKTNARLEADARAPMPDPLTRDLCKRLRRWSVEPHVHAGSTFADPQQCVRCLVADALDAMDTLWEARDRERDRFDALYRACPFDIQMRFGGNPDEAREGIDCQSADARRWRAVRDRVFTSGNEKADEAADRLAAEQEATP